MVWVECEDGQGAGWRATLVDGRINEETMWRAIKKRHPEACEKGVTVYDIAEIATEARNSFHRQYNDKQLATYCDFFVLQSSANIAGKINADRRALRLSQQGMEENISYLLQIDKGCPFYKECLQSAAKSVEMESRPESEYPDFESYKAWIREFSQELLTPYIAPCMIVAHKIRQYGFQCCGE